MRADELLVLNYPNLKKRLQELYLRLNDSVAFQSLFLNDPAGILSKTLMYDYNHPPQAVINQANRLLYALLSNPKFMEWAKKFQARIEKQAIEISNVDDPDEALRQMTVLFDRNELYNELIEGIQKYGDVEMIFSLISMDPDKGKKPPVLDVAGRPQIYDTAVEVETLIYALVAAAVFAIAVAAVFIGMGAVPDGVSREDLKRLSDHISKEFADRAYKLRNSGKLKSVKPIS